MNSLCDWWPAPPKRWILYLIASWPAPPKRWILDLIVSWTRPPKRLTLHLIASWSGPPGRTIRAFSEQCYIGGRRCSENCPDTTDMSHIRKQRVCYLILVEVRSLHLRCGGGGGGGGGNDPQHTWVLSATRKTFAEKHIWHCMGFQQNKYSIT